MKEEIENEVVEELDNDADQSEVVLNENEPDVVWEDVPDEDELPVDWEDMLYEEWRDRQFIEELEKNSKR